MSPFAQALLATFLVSVISLIGIVFVLLRDWSERIEIAAISFAAGVLLATAFLSLLPEAVEQAGGADVLAVTLAAICLFFAFERGIHGLHGDPSESLAHGHGGHGGATSHRLVSRYLILTGDSVHNFIDGVVIAAAFIADPALGVATSIAVAAHEIPHELADYSILVSSRLDRLTALGLNFATALTALLGVAICFAFEAFVARYLHWFMAAAAGMFLYIATAGLIPQIHHSPLRRSWLCTVPFFAGIALMIAVAAIFPHRH
jgi:zinc and cadmium transporter